MSSERLDGWKAIGDYLQVSDRTARRWAEEAVLPVHRVPLAGRPLVFAVTAELDAWLGTGGGKAARAGSAEDKSSVEADVDGPRTARLGRRLPVRASILIVISAIVVAGLGFSFWMRSSPHSRIVPPSPATAPSDGVSSAHRPGLDGRHAYGIPRSMSCVTLTLVAGFDDQFSVDVPDGGLATVSLGTQRKLGLTPVVRNEELELVVLRLFRRQPGAGETAVQSRTIRLRLGTSSNIEADTSPVSVTWANVHASGDGVLSAPLAESCCISCGGATVCASGVASTCGRCGSLSRRVISPGRTP